MIEREENTNEGGEMGQMASDEVTKKAFEFRSLIVDLLAAGRNIQAIKAVRFATGLDLRAAKDCVESIAPRGEDVLKRIIQNSVSGQRTNLLPGEIQDLRGYLIVNGGNLLAQDISSWITVEES